MKKIILYLAVIFFFIGCAKQEEPQEETYPNAPACTINGYDCWSVMQVLSQTDITYQPIKTADSKDSRTTRGVCTSTELDQMGISVADCDIYRDGGSRIFKLSDGIYIFNDNRFTSSEHGFWTLSWPDKTVFTFDRKGRVVKYFPAMTAEP